MPTRSLSAFIVVVFLVPLAPPIQADPLLPQNDAGSGGDAPDNFLDALPVGAPSFRGELLATPLGGYAGAHVGDHEDWYKFLAKKNQRLSVELVELGDVADLEFFGQLYSPSGEPALTFTSGFPPDWIITSEKGYWRIRVVSNTGGTRYEVNYGLTSPNGAIVGGHTNADVVVLGFEIPAGGWIGGSIRNLVGRTESMPMMLLHMNFREDGSTFGSSANVERGQEVGAHIHAAGTSVTASETFHKPGSQLKQYADDWELRETGIVYTAFLGVGSYHSVGYEIDLHGDATFLGATTAGQRHVLRLSDFSGLAAAETAGGSVAKDVVTTIKSRRAFVFGYDCFADWGLAKCRILDPAGGVTSLSNTFEWRVGLTPGTWTFARDTYVSPAQGQDVILLGAEVKLPH